MMSKTMPAWLAMLFLAMLAVGTDEFVIAGVLPEIADDLEVSAAAAGQLVTVSLLCTRSAHQRWRS